MCWDNSWQTLILSICKSHVALLQNNDSNSLFAKDQVVTIPQWKIGLEATTWQTETSVSLANARPWNALLILELFHKGMTFLWCFEKLRALKYLVNKSSQSFFVHSLKKNSSGMKNKKNLIKLHCSTKLQY